MVDSVARYALCDLGVAWLPSSKGNQATVTGVPMNHPTFGEELRRRRRQRGLSLKKFAQLVHFDPGYLSKIENGLKPPTDTVACKCDAVLQADGVLSAFVPAPVASRRSGVVQGIRIPVVIDGRPMLLPIKRNAQLSITLDSDDGHTTQPAFGEVLSRGLPGSSAAIVLNGAGTTWQWELPVVVRLAALPFLRAMVKFQDPLDATLSSPTEARSL
jgi:transcriptional regulator with XRE-family HTH domain